MTTRYRVGTDLDFQLDECDGGAMPMSPERYKGNECRACPQHPRAGTKVLDLGGDGRPQAGCAVCGNTEYAPVPYEEYVAYYGNPERHIGLFVVREDQCPCCQSWVEGGALYGIDVMDDNPEAAFTGDGHDTYTREELPGYLQEVADELEPATFTAVRS